MKVYLSPSNQYDNLYAYGNTNEMIQCNRIAEAAEKYLKANGFDVKRAPQGQNMNVSINESNAWGADVHICIHTNAGGGKGCEVYTYSGAANELKYARPIYNEIAAVTQSNDRGLKVANFAELRATTAMAVYCECEFHDNATIAQWIIENVDVIGKAIAKGMCASIGQAFSEDTPSPAPEPSPAPSEILYRVQVGAYAEKNNADNMAAKLKAAGYDTYMVQGNGLYKVQVGAYAVKSNADAMAAKLKAAGYETYITTKGGTPVSATPTKSIDEVAREVIRGDWGNGAERFARLEAAGYDADAVQARVNALL